MLTLTYVNKTLSCRQHVAPTHHIAVLLVEYTHVHSVCYVLRLITYVYTNTAEAAAGLQPIAVSTDVWLRGVFPGGAFQS